MDAQSKSHLMIEWNPMRNTNLCRVSICTDACDTPGPSLTCSPLGQLNLNFSANICRGISIPDHNPMISFKCVDAKLSPSSQNAAVRSWQMVTNLRNEILTRHQLIERTCRRTLNEACAIVSRLQNIHVKCAECSSSLLGNGAACFAHNLNLRAETTRHRIDACTPLPGDDDWYDHMAGVDLSGSCVACCRQHDHYENGEKGSAVQNESRTNDARAAFLPSASTASTIFVGDSYAIAYLPTVLGVVGGADRSKYLNCRACTARCGRTFKMHTDIAQLYADCVTIQCDDNSDEDVWKLRFESMQRFLACKLLRSLENDGSRRFILCSHKLDVEIWLLESYSLISSALDFDNWPTELEGGIQTTPICLVVKVLYRKCAQQNCENAENPDENSSRIRFSHRFVAAIFAELETASMFYTVIGRMKMSHLNFGDYFCRE